MTGLVEYYGRRAAEYDRIYAKPERQEDLRALQRDVAEAVRERRVLELACGTGWWTRVLAGTAENVVATDAGDEVLEIARRREYAGSVEIRRADAFTPESIDGDFDTIVAAFWVSHLRRDALGPFLDTVDDRLPTGGRVVLLDNRYVEGSSTPVSRRDDAGNTYQNRRLADGSEYEVMKNFFRARELRVHLETPGRVPRVRELAYFWIATYDLVAPAGGVAGRPGGAGRGRP